MVWSRSKGRVARVSAAIILASAVAHGVVIQIDGTILPYEGSDCPGANDQCLQSGLNVGEGFAADSTANPLDARQDGAITPELYTVPLDDSDEFEDVTVYYIMHGAGFDNAFGWYNADDPSTRYQIFDGTEKGNNSTPNLNVSTTLDFEALCARNASGTCTGNYKGGAVGFYLQVPTNCGDTCDDHPDSAGRIYFTQNELNADGNYVHFLVYSSKVDIDPDTGQPLSFYFGFEDLFRGGDNDFDDSFFKVDGLIVPCERMAEVCDGQDNDCDGLVDNIDYSGLPPCFPNGFPPDAQGVGICSGGQFICTMDGDVFEEQCVGSTFPHSEDYCDGLDNDCDGELDEGGVDPATDIADVCPADAIQGECSADLVCLSGSVECQVSVGPTDEICDSLDNDCDGEVDEIADLTDTGRICACTGRIDQDGNRVPSGAPCNRPTAGECQAGLTVCTAQGLICDGYVGPSAEICDGLDNNCNGQIDEGLGGTATCSPSTPPGVFVCSAGVEQCINGVAVCTGFELGSPELCNGLDDDCDGTVDENPVDVGFPCGNTLGVCQAGTTQCTNGSIVCGGNTGGSTEICNGIDDDCDGAIDEHTAAEPLPAVGEACEVTDACTGTRQCIDGNLTCVVTSGTPEVCNGIDDDCDGEIDEDPVDAGGVCSTAITETVGNTGLCEFGVLECVVIDPNDLSQNELQCVGEIGPTDETCNGIDDNCDGFIDNDPDGTGPFVLGGEVDGRTVLVGEACGGSGDGGTEGCQEGAFVCLNGVMTCDSQSTVRVEVCNGIDDDCNGIIDDGDLPRVGEACGSAFPPCQPGVLDCVDGKLECLGATQGTEEICNDLDDDCDGIVDNPPPGGFEGAGELCPPDGLELPIEEGTLCRAGKLRCHQGELACIGAVGPFEQELCNGIDDTCNGEVDENIACPGGTECFMGNCRERCGTREFPCPGGLTCVSGFCVPIGVGPGSGGSGGGSGSGDGGPGSGEGGPGGGSGGTTGSDGGIGSNRDGGAAASSGSGARGGSTGGEGGPGSGSGGEGTEDDSEDVYGLATGGGGIRCSTGAVPRGGTPALWVLALGLLLWRRRRAPRSGEGVR